MGGYAGTQRRAQNGRRSNRQPAEVSSSPEVMTRTELRSGHLEVQHLISRTRTRAAKPLARIRGEAFVEERLGRGRDGAGGPVGARGPALPVVVSGSVYVAPSWLLFGSSVHRRRDGVPSAPRRSYLGGGPLNSRAASGREGARDRRPGDAFTPIHWSFLEWRGSHLEGDLALVHRRFPGGAGVSLISSAR